MCSEDFFQCSRKNESSTCGELTDELQIIIDTTNLDDACIQVLDKHFLHKLPYQVMTEFILLALIENILCLNIVTIIFSIYSGIT